MKKPFKVFEVLPCPLLIIVFALIVILGASACNPHPGTNLQSAKLIPQNLFRDRLVSYKDAENNKKHLPGNAYYTGGIIRNTDVLLSLGLNNDSLYSYTQCESIRLKTMLGIDSVTKEIKLYAHPVLIANDSVKADLYFDVNGNLYLYNGHGNATPFTPDCEYPGNPKLAKKAVLKDLAPKGLFVIDLNNPCPPCS